AIGCALVGTWLAVQSVSAQSLGFHNLPCTVPQYTGHGFGAGHHAPLIRGTHCQASRMQRYVRVPGCGAFAALPMNAFPISTGPGCHAQLDQLLRSSDDEVLPVMPTEAMPPARGATFPGASGVAVHPSLSDPSHDVS